MMVDCIQTLTLRESARSEVDPSTSAHVRKIPTIHNFLKLNPNTFHGEDLNDVVDRAMSWISIISLRNALMLGGRQGDLCCFSTQGVKEVMVG